MIGQTISHYKILEKLGGGGMGVVYKAEDTQLKRTVALKFLPPSLTLDSEAQTRFVHEARAASALDHSNICTIHEIGHTDGGQLFIVMAGYEGETLKKKIEQGPLEIDLALDIAIQIAEGLVRAHEAGIVHRDIKPANLFITDRNELKILDFGLAKLTGQTMLTKTGSTLGTAAYMSPEQARGETVDRGTDIWSLGVVLYEMLTGHTPFRSDYEQALIYSILNETPKPMRETRPEVPEVVEQIVGKAMAKGKEERYQRTEDLLSDLKAARGGVEQSGVTIAAIEAIERKRKKKRTRMLMAAGIALLVLAGVLFVALPLMQDQALASNPKAVAFISFENKTGDDSLGYLQDVIPGLLSTSLEDSKYFRVIGQDRIRSLVKQFKKDTIKVIDRDTWLFLFRKAGIDVLGAGSFTKGGPLFLTEIQLVDVKAGEPMGTSMKARGQGLASFFQEDGIVNDLARQVSRGLGVSRISTQASDRPVAEVTSSSMEAQQYYQRGKLELEKFNFVDARSFLELAVKEDSTFASAWYQLGITNANLGDGGQAQKSSQRAVRLASQVTERERWLIAPEDSGLMASLLGRETREVLDFLKARAEKFPSDADFRRDYAMFLRGNGNVKGAIVECEEVIQLDQANPAVLNELAYCYVFDGQGEKGIKALERYAEIQPGDPNPFDSMGDCLLILGRFDEAIPNFEKALKVKPDFYNGPRSLARAHFMKENYDEAIRWIDHGLAISPSPTNRAEHLFLRAWYLIWLGRLREAEAALGKSERMASPDYDQDLFRLISWLKGWCAYERGDWKRARLHLSDYAKRSNRWWYSQFCLGLVDVQQGMKDSMDMRLQRMEDIGGRRYSNALKGLYLLVTHRPAEIQPNWKPKRSWFMQMPDSLATACWPLWAPWGGVAATLLWIPIPFDILPRAYVERGMIDSAIAFYELALKKPPHLMGPIIPRYYYRLARLYEQKGIKDKAIENYTHFLRIWGKADPIYKEPTDARSRLAGLKRGLWSASTDRL
jgi:tetratricopeptide (TPR) repeat protein